MTTSRKLFREIKSQLRHSHIVTTARRAGVSTTTLYNWRKNKTKHPRLDTIERVAGVFGYKLAWSAQMPRQTHSTRHRHPDNQGRGVGVGRW